MAKALRLAKGVQTLLAKRPAGKRQQRRTQTVPFSKCGARIKFALKHVSRTFAIAPKASFETPGEYAFLSLERKRRCAPHPPPKRPACCSAASSGFWAPALVRRIDAAHRVLREKIGRRTFQQLPSCFLRFKRTRFLQNSNIR